MFAAALREEAHRELIFVEESSAYRQARVQEELVQARHGEEQSAGLWRIEMASAHAQAAAEQEAAVARCRFLAGAALDYARANTENRFERLEEGFVRERDRVAVAKLALADWGAQLREERAMLDSNDRWTQCKFLRASMKSFLWLWLLREIVAENTKEVKLSSVRLSIKVPMVPYLMRVACPYRACHLDLMVRRLPQRTSSALAT